MNIYWAAHITYKMALLVATVFLLHSCSSSSDDSSARQVQTFTDSASNLEWASFEQVYYHHEYTYDDIVNYCDTLEVGDKSDWRIPSADEVLDYLIRNTVIYDDSMGSYSFITNHTHDFTNILDAEDDAYTYSSSNTNSIVFSEVPYIKHDSEDRRIYGSLWIGKDDPEDPNDWPDNTTIYNTDETTVLKPIGYTEIYDPPIYNYTHHAFTCVRGIHKAAKLPFGTWVNIENQAEIPGTEQYVYGLTIVDNQHIRLSTLMYEAAHSYPPDYHYIESSFVIDKNAHYISTGIPDAKVKGVITSFAEAAGSTLSRSLDSSINMKASVSGVAGIDVILGCIKNKEPQYCQEFTIQPATPDNPHNTFNESTDESLPNILYVYQDELGNYALDENNPITIATGEIIISLTDSAGNTAHFTVEISGNDTDVGVLNIPDIKTLYNFKTSINHDSDYIYHGYNDGETQVGYSKYLSICNIGNANISGTTFDIEVDADSTTLIRSFNHNYDGSPVGFTADSCETYNIDFEFYRPTEDVEVKFNITIRDNFNSLTWKDYTTFRLSQYAPIDVYLASNTQHLEGFLVAPGNELVRIEFYEYDIYDYTDKVVRVPSYTGNEYSIILYNSSVAGEDTYMITTTNPPDRSKMDGFSDVTAYEPNDDAYNATTISFLNDEIVSYLHSGDLDFFTLKDTSIASRSINNGQGVLKMLTNQ